MLLFERLFSIRQECNIKSYYWMCVKVRMFADVGMRCGGWEDAYFKGQVGVEYEW